MRYPWILMPMLIGCGLAAQAEGPRANIGVLTCTVGVAGKSEASARRNMTCGFRSTVGGAAEEKYDGTVGAVQGRSLPDGKQVLVWAVLAPANTKVAAGALAQTYVKVDVGVQTPGTQVLIGSTNKAIALQFETSNALQGNDVIINVELKLASTAA